MKEPLVSIIVPIYNVEQYLDECIGSIINQTYKNIEIILVDDGSTDSSGSICDRYASQDSRIKVIHQENRKLTVTRRVGVNFAQGKFIGFVDGDDWIDADMYQQLVDIQQRECVDIVTAGGYREYSWGRSSQISADSMEEGKYNINQNEHEILRYVLATHEKDGRRVNGGVWNKLFRTEVIKPVLNKMNDNVHGMMDDTICVMGALMNAKNVYISKEVVYHHREREGSFTHSKNLNIFTQLNNGYLCMKNILEDSEYGGELLPILEEYMAYQLLESYNHFFEGTKYELPQYWLDLKIPANSKIVVYGAGNVGRSYAKQIIGEDKYQLVAVVDRTANGMVEGYKIQRKEDLLGLDYDYIVISVLKNHMAEQIRQDLIEYGIPSQKIIWEFPYTLSEKYNIIKN